MPVTGTVLLAKQPPCDEWCARNEAERREQHDRDPLQKGVETEALERQAQFEEIE